MSGIDRREAVSRLFQNRGDLLVVTGLGASAYDLAACGDSPLDFPLWGAMGGAAMMGLGLALAQPERAVVVLTGDGEMLMGLGSLATIAVAAPRNLRIVVLDNERFGETGNQETHTAHGTDLAGVAAGCGFDDVRTVTALEGIERLRADLHAAGGPLFAVIKISPEEAPKVLPPRDGPYLTHRIRAALLGPSRALAD